MIRITTLTTGISRRSNHHPGLPTIFNSVYTL